MQNFVITYDLPSGNYEAVERAIDALGGWAKAGTTTFCVFTQADLRTICNQIGPFLGPKDRLFVVDATNNDWNSIGQPDEVVRYVKERWCR
jgi:hypothetical protein